MEDKEQSGVNSALSMTWYGTASLVFRDAKDCFAVDPFMKYLSPEEEPIEAKEQRRRAFQECRKVLLTHGHFDHMASLAELYMDQEVTIYATAGPAAHLSRLGFQKEQILQIAPGDHFVIGDCQIVCHKGKHVNYDFPLIREILTGSKKGLIPMLGLGLRYPEYNETVLYEIVYQERRILIMGSADLSDDSDCLKHADALILPHQGRSDITEHNFRLLKDLCPKQVYIDHYDNAFPPLSHYIDCNPLIEKVRADLPEMAIEPLREGKTVNF